ncbi:MAG: two-component regulator propeller domain-containing protein [Paludibacteraceae bacterium]
MKAKKVCLLLLCLVGAVLLHARPHNIRNLSTRDGLNDLLINVIHRDTTGMVWLGTGSTVECFDGVRVNTYPIPGNAGTQKRITAIVGKSADELYISNGDGIFRLQDGKFQPVYHDIINSPVFDLALSNTGVLYAGTSRGLYAMEPDGHTTRYLMNQSDIASANQLRALCFDEKGTLWITSKAGLHSLSTDRQISHYLHNQLPIGGFISIAVRKGVVYLGTFHDGIYTYNIRSGAFLPFHPNINPIMALQAAGQDSLYVGTDGGGVYILNTQTRKPVQEWTQNSPQEHLTSNSVYSMLYDEKDRMLFVGFYQHGMDYTLYQSDAFGTHNTPLFNSEGLAVRSLAIHDQQRVIGTRQGLYFVDKATQRFRYYSEKELNSQMVFSLLWHDGVYIVGTYGGGLYVLDPATLSLTRAAEGIGGQIFSLCEDEEGHIWAGTEQGAYCFERRQHSLRPIHAFTSRNSQLPGGSVYHISFDHMGRGWICTLSGVALYDAKEEIVRTDAFPPSFPASSVIRQVYNTEDDYLIFVPDKGELFVTRLDLSPVREILPLQETVFAIEDNQQHLWIGTTNGLYNLTHDNTLRRYTYADGLPGNIFTLCQPQTDHEGTIWLGNSQGLVWVKPDSVYLPHPPAYKPQISRIEQDDNSLTFHLSDMLFTLPDCAAFEYRLDGVDDEWQYLQGSSVLHYTSLRPGNYTLHIRRPGYIAGENTATAHIPLSPMQWLTGVIILLCICLVAAIVRMVYLRVVQRRKQRQEAVELPQESTPTTENTGKYRTLNMSPREQRELAQRVKQVMEEERLYRDPELKLSILAGRLGVPQHHLSYLFSQYMKTSFSDYLNQLRVEEFRRIVVREDASRYTLDALAQQCGFQSRASFFRNFKKFVGQTPTEYMSRRR